MDNSNIFDYKHAMFFILINNLKQYSLWPTFKSIPNGWNIIFGPDNKLQCFSWLEENWCDILPQVKEK